MGALSPGGQGDRSRSPGRTCRCGTHGIRATARLGVGERGLRAGGRRAAHIAPRSRAVTGDPDAEQVLFAAGDGCPHRAGPFGPWEQVEVAAAVSNAGGWEASAPPSARCTSCGGSGPGWQASRTGRSPSITPAVPRRGLFAAILDAAPAAISFHMGIDRHSSTGRTTSVPSGCSRSATCAVRDGPGRRGGRDGGAGVGSGGRQRGSRPRSWFRRSSTSWATLRCSPPAAWSRARPGRRPASGRAGRCFRDALPRDDRDAGRSDVEGAHRRGRALDSVKVAPASVCCRPSEDFPLARRRYPGRCARRSPTKLAREPESVDAEGGPALPRGGPGESRARTPALHRSVSRVDRRHPLGRRPRAPPDGRGEGGTAGYGGRSP